MRRAKCTLPRVQAVVEGLPTASFTTLTAKKTVECWEWRPDHPEDLRQRSASVESGTIAHSAELTDWLEHHGAHIQLDLPPSPSGLLLPPLALATPHFLLLRAVPCEQGSTHPTGA